VVCHPLCDSHIGAEATDPLSPLRKVESTKAASYAHVLDGARSAAAVTSGLRVIVYNTCSFTSLGALGKGTVRCSTRPPATSRSVRWLLRGLLRARTVSHHRDCLGCFGFAFAANFRLPSCAYAWQRADCRRGRPLRPCCDHISPRVSVLKLV
jgi:hypothetical protein